MDYGKVLSRAWEITWRWKVLWILGLLAALGKGLGGGNLNWTLGNQDLQQGPWFRGQPGPEFWAGIAGIILVLICLLFLVAIALWVISIIARGGLIAGVQQVEDEGSTSFGFAWRVGVKRFWTLLGISILAALPALILVFVLAALVAAGIVIAGGVTHFSEAAGAAGIIAAVLCGGTACCGLILVAIVLDQIRVYAERAAVLDGLTWIDAFKRGWQVIRDHLGPTVVLWIIFFAIGFVLMAVIGGALAVVVLLFAVPMANIKPAAWLIAPACCGGLLALIVVALIRAVVETFTSATWTLAYRELTGSAAQPAAEV